MWIFLALSIRSRGMVPRLAALASPGEFVRYATSRSPAQTHSIKSSGSGAWHSFASTCPSVWGRLTFEMSCHRGLPWGVVIWWLDSSLLSFLLFGYLGRRRAGGDTQPMYSLVQTYSESSMQTLRFKLEEARDWKAECSQDQAAWRRGAFQQEAKVPKGLKAQLGKC